jgi:hypothetical protein
MTPANTADPMVLTSTPPATSASGPTYSVVLTASTPKVAPTAEAMTAPRFQPPVNQ